MFVEPGIILMSERKSGYTCENSMLLDEDFTWIHITLRSDKHTLESQFSCRRNSPATSA